MWWMRWLILFFRCMTKRKKKTYKDARNKIWAEREKKEFHHKKTSICLWMRWLIVFFRCPTKRKTKHTKMLARKFCQKDRGKKVISPQNNSVCRWMRWLIIFPHCLSHLVSSVSQNGGLWSHKVSANSRKSLASSYIHLVN